LAPSEEHLGLAQCVALLPGRDQLVKQLVQQRLPFQGLQTVGQDLFGAFRLAIGEALAHRNGHGFAFRTPQAGSGLRTETLEFGLIGEFLARGFDQAQGLRPRLGCELLADGLQAAGQPSAMVLFALPVAKPSRGLLQFLRGRTSLQRLFHQRQRYCPLL
jgi:hypothetical protein